MRAEAVTIRSLLEHRDEDGRSRPVQFRVPVFQRDFSWGVEQVQQLAETISDRAADQADASPHFLGAFVLMEEVDQPGGPDRLMVIDGQQRLVTLAVTISHLEERRTGAASILQNPDMTQSDRDRIRPAEVDAIDFDEICAGRSPKSDRRLPLALSTVEHAFRDADAAAILDALLDRIEVVRVILDRTEDAETVFESLNTTGLPLSQADLIRMVLLAQFAVDEQLKFDARYWRPMESRLRDAVPDRRGRERSSPKDRIVGEFLRDVLMMDGRRFENWRTYRTFVDGIERNEDSAKHHLGRLERLSAAYLDLLAPKPVSGAASVFQRLRLLGYNVHWPLYLQLRERADAGDFPAEEVDLVMNDLESFFIRRIAAGWRTNILGRVFSEICRTRPADRMEIARLLEPHWPGDRKFTESIATTEIYRVSWGGCRLMLQRLDLAYGNKESRIDDEASVEHVMPQTIGSDERGRAWQDMLGPDWEQIHQRWLHTLPNLSMTRTNSEMSNFAFVSTNEEKSKRHWYRKSLFQMNQEIAKKESWGEPELLERAEHFQRRALSLWPLPPGLTGWGTS